MQTFGDAMAKKLLCQPNKSSGAGCTSSSNYYKKKGQFYEYDPRPGDQIFFYATDGNGFGHTGIVEQVSGNKVTTIEGNTSAGKEIIPNGGSVCKKSYALNNSRIGGYGRPDWSLVGDQEKEDEVDIMLMIAKVATPDGGRINFRQKPGGTVIDKVLNGTEVQVLEHYDDEWDKVAVNGKTGYMMRRYLEYDSEQVVFTIDRASAEAFLAALTSALGE